MFPIPPFLPQNFRSKLFFKLHLSTFLQVPNSIITFPTLSLLNKLDDIPSILEVLLTLIFSVKNII